MQFIEAKTSGQCILLWNKPETVDYRNVAALQCNSLVQDLCDHLEDNITLYVDLPNMRVNDNPLTTIPESILVISAHPDIVLVEEDDTTLLELTILHNYMESSNARIRKSTKENYQQILSDLESNGFSSTLYWDIGPTILKDL